MMRDKLEDKRKDHAVTVGATTEKTSAFLRFSHHTDDGTPLPEGSTQFAAPSELLKGGHENIIVLECAIGEAAIAALTGQEEFRYNMETGWNIKASPATENCD
jgi:hypothetical protein